MDWIAIAGCFARTLAFVHVAPGLAEAAVPARTRLGLAALLALVLAPAGGVGASTLAGRLVAEALCGLLLGLLAAMPWSALVSACEPLVEAAGLEGEDAGGESTGARLASAFGIAAFLALSGDRFLIKLLATPRQLALDGASLGDLAARAGGATWGLVAEALLPFLFVLALARIAAALVARAAQMDLQPVLAPALVAAGLLVAGGFCQAAPGLFEAALDSTAALAGAPPPARQSADDAGGER